MATRASDSLSRPSVSFDISQKEKEIAELALPVIPNKLRNLLIINEQISKSLKFKNSLQIYICLGFWGFGLLHPAFNRLQAL